MMARFRVSDAGNPGASGILERRVDRAAKAAVAAPAPVAAATERRSASRPWSKPASAAAAVPREIAAAPRRRVPPAPAPAHTAPPRAPTVPAGNDDWTEF
jgi:hypothetical protein